MSLIPGLLRFFVGVGADASVVVVVDVDVAVAGIVGARNDVVAAREGKKNKSGP